MGTHLDERSEAFEHLFVQVYEPLQRYLHRRCPADDVDDVLNDVLTTLWRRLDEVPEHVALPWAYGVARRSLANHRRSRNRVLRLVARTAAQPSTTPDRIEWTDELDGRLHAALAHLSECDREVVRLWAWEQLEPREIAAVLDTTPNAVSVRLNRIKRSLRADLARQDQAAAGHKRIERHGEV